MERFEEFIKKADYTPGEIFEEYLTSGLAFGARKGPGHYQNWAETELNRVTDYLYHELKTGAQRKRYIEQYIERMEGEAHYLRANLSDHIGELFNDSEGLPLIEEIPAMKPLEILHLYKRIIPIHLSQKIIIEEKKLNGAIVPIYKNMTPTSSMILATGLLKFYEQADNEDSAPTAKAPKIRKTPRITLEYNNIQKEDLRKLKVAGRVRFMSFKKLEEGDLIDFDDKMIAFALFDKWRDAFFVSEENMKNYVIECNATIKGKPLINSHNDRVKYERNKNEYNMALKKILNPA